MYANDGKKGLLLGYATKDPLQIGDILVDAAALIVFYQIQLTKIYLKKEKNIVKIRVVLIFFVTVCFMLSMITTAMGETDIKSLKWSLYDYLIDDYIQKC